VERHFPGKPERDRLLLALMAYGGLRRSELLRFDWDDVDLARRLLRVRRAKGGRQRTIPIHPALAPLFADYYATRVPLTEQAVFVGVQGKRLHYTQLGQTFRHYVNAAGVNERKRVTPHTLRHVFASELLHAGEPAPDPGAAWPQAPRLDPALHARERARAPGGDQAAALGRRASAVSIL
jgi:integrase